MAQHELKLSFATNIFPIEQNDQQKHSDSSHGSIIHLSGERTAPKGSSAEPRSNIASVLVHFQACDFHLQTTKKVCVFGAVLSAALDRPGLC